MWHQTEVAQSGGKAILTWLFLCHGFLVIVNTFHYAAKNVARFPYNHYHVLTLDWVSDWSGCRDLVWSLSDLWESCEAGNVSIHYLHTDKFSSHMVIIYWSREDVTGNEVPFKFLKLPVHSQKRSLIPLFINVSGDESRQIFNWVGWFTPVAFNCSTFCKQNCSDKNDQGMRHVRRILKNVQQRGLTSMDILQWNVRREFKICGEGLAVRQTKCPAKLKRISRTLHWTTRTKFYVMPHSQNEFAIPNIRFCVKPNHYPKGVSITW